MSPWLAPDIQTDIFPHGAQARPLAGELPRGRARVSPECPSGGRVPALSGAGRPRSQRLEADAARRLRGARDPDPRGRGVFGCCTWRRGPKPSTCCTHL